MKKIPIDRRALPVGAVLLVLMLAAVLVPGLRPLSPVLFFVLAGHLLFFRDPVRPLPAGDDPVSPADGRVVEVAEQPEDRFLKQDAVKIGIFLSIFDNHVTRAPSDGTVAYLEYVPGKFFNALREKSVYYNESNWIGIADGERRVLVRQVAGAIARRIHCDAGMNDPVRRAGKLGIICYGSRVEFFVPKNVFKPRVRPGDCVQGGLTVLGEWLK